MNTNPPIKGHTLQHEGYALFNQDGTANRSYQSNYGSWLSDLGKREGYGKCECGLMFGPGLSKARVQQAHREHKAALRGPVEFERYRAAMVLLDQLLAYAPQEHVHHLSTTYAYIADKAQELP